MSIQLLLERKGDYFQTGEQMLAKRPVEVFHIMGLKETIPYDQVTIMDWIRLLALEESFPPALPELETKVLQELVRGLTEYLPNAATRLVCDYRAQMVDGAHP